MACLRHPGLPAILDLGEASGRPYIVQELVRGRTLSQVVAEGPVPERTIVEIAKRLAGTLAEVHRAGMVHCDVKPDNILVHETDGARLVDFGFAVRARADRDEHVVTGTLLYAAPEQTGMLKRPLDGRSDLYSLGVVLYECAAGRPPFTGGDAGEIVRQHAVAPPPDVRQANPDTSPALAAMIHKLLSKDPDDRYQSPDGLLTDLERLDALNEQAEGGGQISLGAVDSPAADSSDGHLVGRDEELDQLLRSWARAMRGRGAVVIVEGAAGLGKSRLAYELVRRVRDDDGCAAVGSCSADKPHPFLPFRQALDDAVCRLDLLNRADRDEGHRRLREAAGDGGPLLSRFSPSLEAVLGEVEDMPGLEAVQDQFFDALADFFIRYARACGGALIVVEDAQWLDSASGQVLARLAPRISTAPLLVLVTLDRQAAADRDVEGLVGSVSSALTMHLTLTPLDDRAIDRLVAARLGDIDARHDFARRIVARSNGSPFAATEFVRSMLDAGLLRPNWGKWLLDEAGLENLDLPTDVVDLVVRRLDALSDESRVVLRAAAVMGSRFGVVLLGKICDAGQAGAHAGVSDGTRARVIERSEAGTYVFVHARVREALLAEMTSDQIRDLHQSIAEVMDRSETGTAEHVYSMARHYALGQVDKAPLRVFEANMMAGKRALAEYAHDEAYAFLRQAERMVEMPGVPPSMELDEALGEVSARSGRIGDAIQYFERTLAVNVEPLERARIRARLAHTHIANFHTEPAWREVRAGFKELGRPFPRSRSARFLSTLWYWARGLLSDLGRPRKRVRGDGREHFVTYAKLCEHGAITSYFGSHPTLLVQMVMRSLFASTRLGPSPELVTSYYQHAVGFAAVGWRRRAIRYIDKAERLAQQLGDRLTIARCRLYHGLVLHLCGDSIEAEAVMRRCLEEHGKWLDSLHYVDGTGDLVFNLVLRGYVREAWTWIERQLPRLKFMSGGVHGKQGNPWAGPVLAALGRTAEALKYQEMTRDFAEWAPPTERYLWGELRAGRIHFQLEQGDCGEIVDTAISDHRAAGLNPRLASLHMRGFYVYQAYARMEQAMAGPRDDRRAFLKRLARAIRELKRAAMIPSMKAHALVVDAALARMRGRHRRARRLLDRADRIARDIDSPWVRYEAARQRAHLLAEQGKHAAARREARIALALATDHRWTVRARRLRAEFDVEEDVRTSLSSDPASRRRRTSSAGVLQLRRQLDALLQVSVAAANVFNPDEQARRALDEVNRILGAERAFLFRLSEEHHDLQFQVGRDAEGNDLDAPTGFSTTVVETVRARCEPIILSGTEDGAVGKSESIEEFGLRSIAAAPLMVRDRITGVLYLDNRLARGVFSEDDLEFLTAIGNHIAVSLETVRAAQLEIRVEAEGRQRRLAESLRDMSHALSSTLNLTEVLQRLLQGVVEAVPSHRASVFLLEDNMLQRTVVWERTESGAVPDLVIPLESDPLLSEVVESLRAAVVRDARRDGRVARHAHQKLFASMIGVPLISHDRVAGVLTLENEKEGAYTDNEAQIAYTFAGQAGIAIENARLFGEVQRLATTDELTGILNRRQFFEIADREFARARRYERPITAIMVDVDHFKRVNDTHGHAVGDEVLKEIARRLAQNIRDVDVLGRYGGEEFALLLPDTDLSRARSSVAERLRAAIADTPIPTEAGPLSMTISVGLAQRTDRSPKLASVLSKADQALYRAKAEGRNRVEAEE